jgi:group I intron endonuclease
MKEKIYSIYMLTSPSGKSYIGQSCRVEKRLIEHSTKQSRCTAISSAIVKYGWENFKIEILHNNLTVNDANLMENLCISEAHKTLAPAGYNLTSGGKNAVFSAESKNRMSASQTGKSMSEASKLKNSISHLGHINTKTHNENISLGKLGIKHSDTHRLNNSLSRKGIPLSQEHIEKRTNSQSRWWEITSPEGIVYIVKNLNKYCKDNGLDNSAMIHVSKGKYTNHKNYKCLKLGVTNV